MGNHKTRWLNFCILVLLVAGLGGCSAKPLPESKKDYVGDWRSPTITLQIFQNGEINYKKVRGSSTTTINGPIKEFDKDNFVVGVWIFTTTFVVQKAPFQEGSRWAMVVDGHKLYRVNLPADSPQA